MLVAGLLNVLSIGLFLYYPDGNACMETVSMLLFGFVIGIQDVVSGFLIGDNHTALNGVEAYDFSIVSIFWLGSAMLSVICVLFVWNAKAKD